MALRVRKSIKVAPGVKVNIGKKSVGVSVGNKYKGVSVNSKAGVTERTSIPGTGVTYTKKIASAPSSTAPKKTAPSSASTPSHSAGVFIFFSILFLLGGVACIVAGKVMGGSMNVSMYMPLVILGVVFIVMGLLFALAGKSSKK